MKKPSEMNEQEYAQWLEDYRGEAGAAGDLEMVEIIDAALAGDEEAQSDVERCWLEAQS